MALADRLRHTIRIERSTTDAGPEDDWGNKGRTWAPVATVKGLAAMKSSREVSELGPEVGDWTIFLLPMDVRSSDRLIRTDVNPNVRFRPTGVRDPGSRGRHLEIDAMTIGGGA